MNPNVRRSKLLKSNSLLAFQYLQANIQQYNYKIYTVQFYIFKYTQLIEQLGYLYFPLSSHLSGESKTVSVSFIMKLQYAIGIILTIQLVAAQWSNDSTDDDGCTTPTGTPGKCIPIKSCQFVLNFFQNAGSGLTQSLSEKIKSYGCGFFGNLPKVCCPNENDSITSNRQGPPDVTSHRNVGMINSPECGPFTIDRLFGGEKTNPFEFPWMALLAYTSRGGLSFKCGGTLINEKYILTAAHCITSLPAGQQLAGIRLGEHDTRTEVDCNPQNPSDCAPRVQDFAIDEIIPHPNYNLQKLENDIGLVRIRGVADMETEAVRPICLPTGVLANESLVSKNAIVTGWGATETGVASPELLQVKVPVMALDECQRRYKQINAQVNIGVKQLCAGRQGKDSCPGDSGGPLKYASIINGDNKYVQYGIVSFGPRLCGQTNQPGVYTNVQYYMDWILDNIKP